jgi:hypothetical protein
VVSALKLKKLLLHSKHTQPKDSQKKCFYDSQPTQIMPFPTFFFLKVISSKNSILNYQSIKKLNVQWYVQLPKHFISKIDSMYR